MDVNFHSYQRKRINQLQKDSKPRLSTEPKDIQKPILDLKKQSMRFAQYEIVKQKNLQKLTQSIKRPSESKLQIPTNSLNESEFVLRSQAQLIQKKEQLKLAQEQAAAQQIAKDLEGVTFHPQISKYVYDKFKDRKRTGADIYENGMVWLKERAQVVEQQREKHIETESASPFKPQVNKISSMMVKGDFYTRLAEHEEKKREKIQKIKNDTTPSFRPKINNKSLHIQSSLSKEQIILRHEPSAFDQIRKMNEKENVTASRMIISQPLVQLETRDQSFCETSQISVNNSFASLVKNMKHMTQHEPVCMFKKQRQHSSVFQSESHFGSTSFQQQQSVEIHEQDHDEITSFQRKEDQSEQREVEIQDNMLSPQFNIQATIKKSQKPLEELFPKAPQLQESKQEEKAQDADITEIMYDYLTSGFEDDDQ